jgi:3-oxoadipate enol-lactonase
MRNCMMRARTFVSEGFVDINGASLFYTVEGSGPPVVFLHGNGLDYRIWDDQAVAFAERYTVVRYDLRGFGRSSLPDGRPYLHAEDLHAVLDALEIRKPAVVGHSMGGGAAVNFAVLYPQDARALVVLASSLGGFAYSQEMKTEAGNLPLTAQRKGIAVAREMLLQRGLFAATMENPRASMRLREIVASYSGWHWMNRDNGQPLAPPAIERLGSISIPTLVMVGERDAADIRAVAETLAVGIPGAKKAVLTGVGHMPCMEDPAAVNALVMRFLEQVQLEVDRERWTAGSKQ